MATVSTTSVCFFKVAASSSWNKYKGNEFAVSVKLTGIPKNNFSSLRFSRFRICCAAKPETVSKVIEIVKKQLALPNDTALTPGSKFSDLGADSLDTVEIVMNLEEEFNISVEEDNSQNITTVQDAAELIDKLVEQKAGAA